jgi:hypothetical protein
MGIVWHDPASLKGRSEMRTTVTINGERAARAEQSARAEQEFTGTRITLYSNVPGGWQARFNNVPGMPNTTLPLPFTWQAPYATVKADMERRFPGIDVI